MTQKKAIDNRGVSPIPKKILENSLRGPKSRLVGVAGEFVKEPVPTYITTPSETVTQGKNNTWIVMGRDRPAGRLSGYGGQGDTQCGLIDIVVGRMGPSPRFVDEDLSKIYVDPSIEIDSARVYISQKTDIDDNFKLVDGRVGNSKSRSGIGIKADGVRIVAREGIKLVTRTDILNSQGGEVKSISGVDIIAGNDDDELQPMVKGDNLAECLSKLTNHVKSLSNIVDTLLMIQFAFNNALTHHVHISPFFGQLTTPSETCVTAGIKCAQSLTEVTKKAIISNKKNLTNFEYKYLKPMGTGYINSRYNNVN